ncbi:hypothetical protein [Nocardioides kribbensis]|uniref:hypothetical protein n=1 Tax=Nocardioides kribbensis TaxID=305517 RepID=UPI0032DA5494
MATSPPLTDPPPAPAGAAPVEDRSGARAAAWGLGVAVVLVALAIVVPRVLDWETWTRAPRSYTDLAVPPLHGFWDPKLFGPGTVPALLVALVGWRWFAGWAETLPWRRLLLVSYVVALAWMVSLALVDGSSGLSRVLGSDVEYLPTAREVDGIGTLLQEYVGRISYSSPDNWPTHVAGHPPLALLFFVGLVRVGLGGDLAAGIVVTVLAATTALAVMTTLRALGHEALARRAAPFLVLAPAAVFMAVSADALFGALGAWGLACLALGASHASRRGLLAWSTLAGLLLGAMVMTSYGLPLLGLTALAVLALARSWLPLPVAAGAALVVVLGFAAGGFAWWEAYPVLHDRYWEGIAADRPASYWLWGNLAALVLSAGPLLGSALAVAGLRARQLGRDVLASPLLLVLSAALAVAVADASRMSKAEVERIWVPFVPWMMIGAAFLPERWRRWGLGLQLVAALLLQHLMYTSW